MRAVVGALQMAPEEVVVAFVLVEHLVRCCPGVLQTRTTRRVWMACCCLAVLQCTDSDGSTARLHARLERDVFWGMEHEDLKRLIIAVFKYMGWQLPNGVNTGADMAPLPDLYEDM